MVQSTVIEFIEFESIIDTAFAYVQFDPDVGV